MIKHEENIKNIDPPPPSTTPHPHTLGIQDQNKGMEDILDIDSHCPYCHLLSGETTFHLTSC